jgi:hypothetical protein
MVIEVRDKLLREQGQRIIANAFARFHGANLTRGLEKWKEWVLFQQRRERMLVKIIDHQIKSQFYRVKSAFKNWI